MVYKFKVLSEEDNKFYMDIEILSGQTFFDLHDLIQDELEFDRSYLASFFVANHSWKRMKEIPLIEKKDKKNKKAEKQVIMDKAVLSDYVKDAHQKFVYIFDVINDRGFFIELIETKPESPSMYYPVCTDYFGEIPSQIGKKSIQKIFDDDDDELDITSSRKQVPVLDEFLDDIPDVPLDKETETSFDMEMEEDTLDDTTLYKDNENADDKLEDDLNENSEDMEDIEDVPDED
jgi:hypothetical protein